MKVQRWFLPETPDVIGLLRLQLDVTTEGVDRLVAWAHGEASGADEIRSLEHRGDEHKRALERALTTAFTTPLEPEDLYTLSRGIYYWPFAYDVESIDDLTTHERELLAPLGPLDSVFVEGTGYLGWRAGIEPGGTWVLFVAGD